MRTKVLTDAELLFSARDALGLCANVVDTLSARTGCAPEFVKPLLVEAMEASRCASCALLELQRRSVGAERPKVGDGN